MNLGSIWDTISGAAQKVGGAISSGAQSFWNTLTTPSQQSQGTAGIASAINTAGNIVGDVLGILGLNKKAGGDLPASAGIPTWQSTGQVTGSFTTPEEAATYNKAVPGANVQPYQGGPVPSYSAPSTSIGGISFQPAPGAPAPSAPSSSVPRYAGPVGPVQGSGMGIDATGKSYILPTATSGLSGSGASIPGGGSGYTPPQQGTSGSAGGGTSASLGAGSAIQGGSVTGTTTDSSGDNKKKTTQQIAPASNGGSSSPQVPSLVPYANAATSTPPEGFTQTTTPQGGTAYQDKSGNMYVPGASGLQLVKELPGSNGPAWTVNGQSYGLTAQPGIQTQLGMGRVYTLTDNQGNTTYFVQTQNGFAPIIGANLNGQTSGNLTGQVGAVDPNIQVSAQNAGNVKVGPQANGTQPGTGTQPVAVGNTGSPSFNAGGVGNPIDMGALASDPTGDAATMMNAVASGQVSPTTIADFNSSLQTQINGIVSAMTQQSGIDPSSNYNIDPSLVANGDQNILNAIGGDMATFNAVNQQFGVPQLQKQYLGAITTVGGINAAVARVTHEILSDPNMPKGLANNQIAYLANKANELMTPYQAQADTIKAQLQYATSNMRAYYSNYWKSQSMMMQQSRLGITQFKTALDAGAIDPKDSNAIQQWAGVLGMDPTQVARMVSYKSLFNQLTLEGKAVGNQAKQVSLQANQIINSMLTDPNTIPTLINATQQGLLTPDEIMNGLGRSTSGVALRTLYVQAAAQGGVSLAGAQSSYGFAASTKIKQQVAALQNVQGMMADMIKLSAAAPRSVPAINKYILPAGTSIGNVQYSNFGTAVTAMADELSGALGFGSATDMSREMGFNLTDPNLSPAQFEAGMQTVVKPFIETKLKTLQGQMGQYAGTTSGASSGAGTGSGAPAATGSAMDPLSIGL